MTSFTRRSFVKAISALEIGVAHAVTPVSAAMRIADILRLGDRRFKACETRSFMGGSVSITVVHESKDAAVQGIEAAFAEIERLVCIFDRHQPDTPVSILNETGRLGDVPPEFYELMVKARSFHRSSEGAFDPSILPVIEMLENNVDSRGMSSLTKSDLHDVLALAGFESLVINQHEVSFDRSGMAVTLDGIAKGFIIDHASDVLAANGIANHLIDAGGDIRAKGESAAGQPWIVIIEEPGKSRSCSAVIQLKDAAVATSGFHGVYYDSEILHRFCSAETETEPDGCISLSVTAPTAIEADALSTSTFAKPAESAVRFINGQQNIDCMTVSSAGDRMVSRDWEHTVRGWH